jgi:hypothetical protein
VKCPGTGDCCIEHVPDAGCSDVKCCEIVCEIDIFCCRGEWDYVCASKAQQHCPHLCGCVHFGDFDHNANVDLLDFAALQNCFTAEGGAIGPECACADYDDDGDSDLFDFIYFGPH